MQLHKILLFLKSVEAALQRLINKQQVFRKKILQYHYLKSCPGCDAKQHPMVRQKFWNFR